MSELKKHLMLSEISNTIFQFWLSELCERGLNLDEMHVRAVRETEEMMLTLRGALDLPEIHPLEGENSLTQNFQRGVLGLLRRFEQN